MAAGIFKGCFVVTFSFGYNQTKSKHYVLHGNAYSVSFIYLCSTKSQQKSKGPTVVATQHKLYADTGRYE